ncbi:BrnA antitoxin family protein [Propionivibrio sp.]|uniref:BrnA antitoxin family protein n=1 Tax=Propionivibrio sp. TaxID=2212460 RepID=UPI003BF39348
METEHDFSNAKRGAVISASNKSRITIHLDSDILDVFRANAAKEGKGYQTLINDALRQAMMPHAEPVTEETLRRVIREELKAA